MALDGQDTDVLGYAGCAFADMGNLQRGIDFMLRGLRISPRDNRRSAWGALLARGMLNFGQIDNAIQVADDALNDASRIRPTLSQSDIARFASSAEMLLLQKGGLLTGLQK